MSIKKVQIPKLNSRAEFRSETADEEKRTVEVVATTEKPVMRGWFNRYWEVLDMNPKSVRMSRMEKGAPFLDSHKTWGGVDAQLGIVEKAWVKGDQLHARIRFPKKGIDEAADKVFEKIKDGILRNISIGYIVHKLEKQPAKNPQDQNEVPTMRATDWEPMEVSIVTVPADENATVRAAEGEEKFDCEVIETRIQTEDSLMDEIEKQKAAEAAAAKEKAEAAQAAQKAERTRVNGIMDCGRKAKLSDEFVQKHIEAGTDEAEFRRLAIEELAAKQAPVQNPSNAAVTVAVDEREKFRGSLENVIEHRMDSKVELKEGRQLYGLTLRELARESLRVAGQPTGGHAMEMVGRAFHSTSDFPLVLANVVNKRLRKAYDEAPETWKPLVNETEVSDFKTVSRHQIGDAPALLEVKEGGEFTRGTFSEAKEEYSIKTYGRVIALTRQLIINDDLGALQRVISSVGTAAKDLIADLVYALIVNGHDVYAMADTEYVFSSAHANIGTSNAAVASGLASMREKLKKQTSLDGRYLNIRPAYLLAGVEREDEIEKAQSDRFVPTAASGDNTFVRGLQSIIDPRLAAAPYFLFASPSQIDTIEVAYLAGTGRGVFTEQRLGFDVDGLEVKARIDVGAKWIDHRGAVRNAGT